MESTPSLVSGASSKTLGDVVPKLDDSPFHLQNSDHPGMMLVSTHLTGSNFLTWSVAISTALEAKDNVGFIDGSLEVPADETQFCKWKRVDSMIKSWVMNSITKDIADTLIYC